MNFKILLIPAGLLVLLILASFFSTSALWHASSYHSLLGNPEEREWDENVPLIDPGQIRQVPKETALALAKNVMGQTVGDDILGSQLQIDTDSAAIQEVNGELWWIFPLDFRSFFKWQNRDYIPGYIRVSAIDPNRKAQLILERPSDGHKFQIKYTPDAYFGTYLDRNVYYAYPDVEREERTFEVDEGWNPYYVYSITEPTIGFGGYKTTGVVIADPQTGEMKYYKEGEIPSWVDRVRPLDQALDQTTWWGEYADGWLNATFSEENIKKPTKYSGGSDMWFVQLGGETYWFTGLTSSSSKDDALIGLMFVPTKSGSGKAIYYKAEGKDESGVLKVVDGSLGANRDHWDPVQPIPYSIWGYPSWVISVIDGNGFLQRIAIVDINNINNRAIEKDLSTALNRYRQVMSQSKTGDSPTQMSFGKTVGPVKVLRVGSKVIEGQKTFLLLLDGHTTKLFSASGGTKQTLPITIVQAGDSVTLKYFETEEIEVPIESLTIRGIDLQVSPQQQVYDQQLDKGHQDVQQIEDTRDAQRDFNKLTPEEQRELMNQ